MKLLDEQKDKTPKIPLEAFPNPTSGYTNVIVNFDIHQATCEVYDLSGRLVVTQKVTDKTVPVYLGNLPDGIYLIEVRTKENQGSVKVVKK